MRVVKYFDLHLVPPTATSLSGDLAGNNTSPQCLPQGTLGLTVAKCVGFHIVPPAATSVSGDVAGNNTSPQCLLQGTLGLIVVKCFGFHSVPPAATSLSGDVLLNKYYEFKSWDKFISFNSGQFAAYLAKVESLSDLTYLFQKRGEIVDVTSIKDKIMSQLRKDKLVLENLPEAQKIKLFQTSDIDDIFDSLESNFNSIFKVL